MDDGPALGRRADRQRLVARAGWWPGPCLTLIAQARPAEDPWALAVAEMPRRPLPWDDPGQMAADIRQAIRGIRECGGPGVFP